MISYIHHHKLKRLLSHAQTYPARAFTLVEMLVAMTASILLLAAVMTIFQTLSEAVGEARRLGSLDSQLCTVATLLRKELAGASAFNSVDGLAVDTPSQTGYFEIIEGPNMDSSAFLLNERDGLIGDCDDLLFFTAQPVTNELFYGKKQNEVVTADLAEIAYFCRPTPGTSDPQLFTLYHRTSVVYGVNPLPPFDANASMPSTDWNIFYQQYDLSVRRNAAKFLLNSIENLSVRVNRLCHNPDGAPPPMNNAAGTIAPLGGFRTGEDILLTNVVAFDVRVLDPTADVLIVGGFQLQPGDLGYSLSAAEVVIPNQPMYVDLGYSGGNESTFSGYGDGPLKGSPTSARTFDTWDNASSDEAPYRNPLSGLQVTIRLYDSLTRRIRQMTIAHEF